MIIAKRRWWWWTALILSIALFVIIPLSFVWFLGWGIDQGRLFLYIEHGMLNGNNMDVAQALGTAPINAPWYGVVEFRRGGVYDPWALLPSLWRQPGLWAFKFPLHFPLTALSVVVAVPLVREPFRRRFSKRYRREHGLCAECRYNLTGNESGVCPECGTKIAAP